MPQPLQKLVELGITKYCAAVSVNGLCRFIPETRGVSLEQMDRLFEEFQGKQEGSGDSSKSSGSDSLMAQQAQPDVAAL